MPDFPKLGEGAWVAVELCGEHLRLFSEYTVRGAEAAVYDMRAKSWIAREGANDIEDGKRKATELAKGLLGVTELPDLDWKKTGTTSL